MDGGPSFYKLNVARTVCATAQKAGAFAVLANQFLTWMSKID